MTWKAESSARVGFLRRSLGGSQLQQPRHEKNLLKPQFDVDVSCAADYIGQPVATVCSKPWTPYTVSGCRPMKCTTPSADAKLDYVIQEKSLEKRSFAVSATCLKGGMAGEVLPCIFDGEPYTLDGCDAASCQSPRRTQDTGYTVRLGCLG